MQNLKIKTIITIIIFPIMLSLSTCDFLSGIVSEPEVKFGSVEIKSVDFNGVGLLCKVNVENTNSFPIPFPDTNWELFLNNISFASFNIEKDANYNQLTIDAKYSVDIDFQVGLGFQDIFNAIASLVGKKEIDYKIILEVLVPVSRLDTTIPFKIEHEGVIPLLQAPSLSPPTASVSKLDPITGIEVNTSFKFVNPNSFPLPAPKIEFNYKINNGSVAESNMPTEQLAPTTTTTIENRIKVETVKVGLNLINSMISGTKANHVLSYSCDFGIPIPNANINDKIEF